MSDNPKTRGRQASARKKEHDAGKGVAGLMGGIPVRGTPTVTQAEIDKLLSGLKSSSSRATTESTVAKTEPVVKRDSKPQIRSEKPREKPLHKQDVAKGQERRVSFEQPLQFEEDFRGKPAGLMTHRDAPGFKTHLAKDGVKVVEREATPSKGVTGGSPTKSAMKTTTSRLDIVGKAPVQGYTGPKI